MPAESATVDRTHWGEREIRGPVHLFRERLLLRMLRRLLPEDGGDREAVRQFHRVLKPGGICVASVPLNPRLWDHSDEWARHVKRYRPAEFVALFEEAGFEVVVRRYWGFPLGRLYHRFLFAPWLKKTAGQTVAQSESRRDTRVARNQTAVRLAAAVLRFDELFGGRPWGRGMLLGARRRA